MDKLVSPCTSVCRISHKTGFCEGCFRTGDEIAKWRDLSLQQQKNLMDKLHDRRALKSGRSKKRILNSLI